MVGMNGPSAIDRRQALKIGIAASCGAGWLASLPPARRRDEVCGNRPPAFSVIPVVGDGHWTWTEPPEGQTGYLEPRSYELKIGIELEGSGPAEEIISTTTVPVEHPEQKLEASELKTAGCQAYLRTLIEGAGQLVLTAAEIAAGQVISAAVRYRLTLYKQYHGFSAERFPALQKIPPEVRKRFLQDSPGIQARSRQVRKLADELTSGTPLHPWDKAKKFAEWVPLQIKPQIGDYTSVTAALDDRRGDCEEMAGVFIALCRASGIPARLVWVPNHAWAEFFLHDHDGREHWIPAHTACYSWFGYTGAHELVLQKGDRVMLPEKRKLVRLMPDWTRYAGSKPRIRYTAELTPLATEPDGDAGPGARRKNDRGEWQVVSQHPLDRFTRR